MRWARSVPRRARHLGEPSTRVIEEAAQRKAAAIVAGTRGRGVLGGFALGSVSLPLAQAARAPVLLVQEQSRLPGGLGRALRALVALDGSPQAMRALSALLDLESWLGALDLELAYVRAASPSDELDRLQAEEATRDARALLYLGSPRRSAPSSSSPAPAVAARCTTRFSARWR